MLIDEVKTIWPLPWFDESSPDVGVNLVADLDVVSVTLVADANSAEATMIDKTWDLVEHASADTPQEAIRLLRSKVARLFGFEEVGT